MSLLELYVFILLMCPYCEAREHEVKTKYICVSGILKHRQELIEIFSSERKIIE